jgi:YbbR domain-containing protein
MAKEKRSDILLKVFSLILSFALWVYIINVENPTKTMKVYNVPVRLENLENISEQNLALLPNQEVMVTLTVKGPASEVYRTVASNFRVVADLDDLALKKGENEIPIEITSYPSGLDITPSSSVKAKIYLDNYLEREVNIVSEYAASPGTGHFVAGVTINPTSATVKGPAEYVNKVTSLVARGTKENLLENYKEIVALTPVDENGNTVSNVIISPLYVEVNVLVYKTKTVPLNVVTEGTVNEGLELKSLTVTPQEIVIAGPDNLLDQITKIDTEKILLRTITETKALLQSIILPDGITAVNGVSNVTVNAEVEAFGSKTVSKKITTLGLGEGLEVVLSTSSINIVLSGPESKLLEVTEDVLTAELDLSNLQPGQYELSPRIVLPVGLVLDSYTPQVISITIQVKTTPPEP